VSSKLEVESGGRALSLGSSQQGRRSGWDEPSLSRDSPRVERLELLDVFDGLRDVPDL